MSGWAAFGQAASNAIAVERGIYTEKREAQRNRKFQADQAATVHQREVADLRAAGLNPILSAKLGGNPAAHGAQGNFGSIAAAGAQAGSSAVEAYRKSKEAKLLDSSTALNEQNEKKAFWETQNAYENAINSARTGRILEAQASAADNDVYFWRNNPEAYYLRSAKIVGDQLATPGAMLGGGAALVKNLFKKAPPTTVNRVYNQNFKFPSWIKPEVKK